MDSVAMQSDAQVIYTIFGAALCLGGWAIFWLGSRLLGLALGMAFGFAFGDLLSMVLKLDANAMLLVLLSCSLLGALGGVLLMRAATAFVFALAGFLFGALLGRMGCELYAELQHQDYVFNTMVAIVVAASGGIVAALALLMQKYIMIIITSYVGATFLVAGVEYLGKHQPWSEPVVIVLAVGWQLLLVTKLIADGSPSVEYVEVEE